MKTVVRKTDGTSNLYGQSKTALVCYWICFVQNATHIIDKIKMNKRNVYVLHYENIHVLPGM